MNVSYLAWIPRSGWERGFFRISGLRCARALRTKTSFLKNTQIQSRSLAEGLVRILGIEASIEAEDEVVLGRPEKNPLKKNTYEHDPLKPRV